MVFISLILEKITGTTVLYIELPVCFGIIKRTVRPDLDRPENGIIGWAMGIGKDIPRCWFYSLLKKDQKIRRRPALTSI
jgi:hypothetical protein